MGAYRITERSCKQYYKSQSKEKSQIKQKEHLVLRCSFCSAIDRRVRVLHLYIKAEWLKGRTDSLLIVVVFHESFKSETH